MIDPESIFTRYQTSENIPFFMIDKAVGLPADPSASIYSRVWNGDDTAWTILSYKLYGDIAYWYILAIINRHIYGQEYKGIFYAPADQYVFYITDKNRMKEIATAISKNMM